MVITEAFLHCRGIGPRRLRRLREAGIRSWHDCVRQPEKLPEDLRHALPHEACRLLQALDQRDVRFLAERLAPADRWRILHDFFDEASFFDIETTGLSRSASATVITCWHQGTMHAFVEDENLDQFLDLLDEVRLLVSFNGTQFDIPRLLDTFHIPSLPCAHLDLRWIAYHRGMRGGLKEIARQLGLRRPKELEGMSGAAAVDLWWAWKNGGDAEARTRLIRYCAVDTLLSRAVAARLVNRPDAGDPLLWQPHFLPDRNPASLGDAGRNL